MAKLQLKEKDTDLYAFVSGEIDQHTAVSLRAEIDKAIDDLMPQHLILDFKGVTFMDSSGIGLIMGRYKKLNAAGGRLSIANLPRECNRIVAMSGITKVLNIKENSNDQF